MRGAQFPQKVPGKERKKGQSCKIILMEGLLLVPEAFQNPWDVSVELLLPDGFRTVAILFLGVGQCGSGDPSLAALTSPEDWQMEYWIP